MARKLELAPRAELPAVARRHLIAADLGQTSTAVESAQIIARVRRVVRRRWPAMLAVFLIVVIGVAAGSLLRTPVYRASGVIEIRPERTETGPLETLFAAGRITEDVVETEVGLLRSQTLAARVVDDLKLADHPAFQSTSSWMSNLMRRETESVPPELHRQRTIERFRKALTIDPQGNSRLVTIRFEAVTPELAAAAVNGVEDAYIRRRLEDAKRSASFLSTQITEAQNALQDSERRLQAHVRQTGLQIVETGNGETTNLVNDRLRHLQMQLADVQAERYQQQSAYEQAAGRGPQTIDDPVIQNLTVRLADLEREYASLSTTFHDEYPKVQQVREQIRQIKASLDAQVKRGLERLNASYQSALRRETLLNQALQVQQGAAVALTSDAAGYDSLKREVQTNRQLYGALDQKLKEVTISAALKATDVGIIDRATAPLEPSNTPLGANVAMGVVVAMMLALGFAFLREHLDRSVRTLGDVDFQLGVPALAGIPAIGAVAGARDPLKLGRPPGGLLGTASRDSQKPWARIDVAGRAQAILNEAFAALRTSVVLADGSAPPCRLLVTSAQPGEGKTTIAVNLAISLAKLSDRVLLIDADLRRPRVHQALGLAEEPGLSGFLTGGEPWRSCLQKGPLPNLDVLAGGQPTIEGPAELTSSPLLRRLLEDAEKEYDFIVLDSPAVLSQPADVRTLAALADGTLLTVRSGSTPREVVWQALSQLRHTLGIVLNGLPMRDVADWRDDLRTRGSEA